MGGALAIAFERAGNIVTLCGTEFDRQALETIRQERTHPELGVAIPPTVAIADPGDWGAALGESSIVCVVVISSGVRNTVEEAAPHVQDDAVWAIGSKGWDGKRAQPLSTVVEAVSPLNPVVMVVGPSLAWELAAGTPTLLVCAGRNLDAARRVADALSSASVRTYVTDDVAGVEVGSALKNVLAIAVGMCDGLTEAKGRPMTNTKAALFSRGLVEMARLARAMGGRESTVLGLAGAGDLFVTVLGGRNGRFGRLVGAGLSPAKALEEMAVTVEGFENAREAMELAGSLGVDLPVSKMVYSVLHEGLDPEKALEALVSGPVEPEL